MVSAWSRNAPDLEIMAYAKTNDYVVLTHDLDFAAILAATQGEKPSVLQIRSDLLNPDVIGKQVVSALRQMAMELAEGALVTVDPGFSTLEARYDGLRGSHRLGNLFLRHLRFAPCFDQSRGESELLFERVVGGDILGIFFPALID